MLSIQVFMLYSLNDVCFRILHIVFLKTFLFCQYSIFHVKMSLLSEVTWTFFSNYTLKVARATWSRSWAKWLKINISRSTCWPRSWPVSIKISKTLWVHLKYFPTLKMFINIFFFIKHYIFLNTNWTLFLLF